MSKDFAGLGPYINALWLSNINLSDKEESKKHFLYPIKGSEIERIEFELFKLLKFDDKLLKSDDGSTELAYADVMCKLNRYLDVIAKKNQIPELSIDDKIRVLYSCCKYRVNEGKPINLFAIMQKEIGDYHTPIHDNYYLSAHFLRSESDRAYDNITNETRLDNAINHIIGSKCKIEEVWQKIMILYDIYKTNNNNLSDNSKDLIKKKISDYLVNHMLHTGKLIYDETEGSYSNQLFDSLKKICNDQEFFSQDTKEGLEHDIKLLNLKGAWDNLGNSLTSLVAFTSLWASSRMSYIHPNILLAVSSIFKPSSLINSMISKTFANKAAFVLGLQIIYLMAPQIFLQGGIELTERKPSLIPKKKKLSHKNVITKSRLSGEYISNISNVFLSALFANEFLTNAAMLYHATKENMDSIISLNKYMLNTKKQAFLYAAMAVISVLYGVWKVGHEYEVTNSDVLEATPTQKGNEEPTTIKEGKQELTADGGGLPKTETSDKAKITKTDSKVKSFAEKVKDGFYPKNLLDIAKANSNGKNL